MRYRPTIVRTCQTVLIALGALFVIMGPLEAQTPSSSSPAASQSQSSSMSVSSTLAPGDVLKVAVYGFPDLGTVTRVSPNGTISFPLIGQLAVGGASVHEAEESIASRLERGGFVKNAAVTIFVEQRSGILTSSVTLLGQVGHSGIYSLDPEAPDAVSTLVELLAKSGGTGAQAANYCYLIRKDNGKARKLRVDLVNLLQNGNMDLNTPLKNGDIVLVPEMDVFYIYGEVQHPGRYKLEKDMSVMQGLSVAGGMTERGNAKGMVLNRAGEGEIKSLKSNLEDRLQPNDVVYVRTAVF